MLKRWFFLWVLGVIIASAVAYGVGGGLDHSLAGMPDPKGARYKGHKDIWALWYIQDTTGELQKEHQMILAALDDLNATVEKLEKRIESLRNSP
jgi:peptidoglycan hydrolase CwlO-like protein